MATFEDCQTIRAEFGSGVSATIDFFEAPCIADCAPSVDYPAGTVWGQNGEGAFSCGLGDWTSLAVTDEVSVWKWDADTSPVGQSGAPRPLDSPTACDGAAQMDLRFYASDLLSPLIDLTGVARPVIHFTHYLCTLSEDQEIAFMTYSRDGGTTWLDTVPITSNSFINSNEQSETFDTEVIKMPFCGDEIGNTAEFRIRFIANGNFYFWTIDDVYITDETIADAEAFTGWFAGAPNFKTPASQVDKIAFMVDANNNGNVDFDDASFTATVTKDGTELHSVTQQLGALPKCTNVENVIAPDFWDMSAELGMYEINYTLDATSDFDDTEPDNNTVGSSFMVTESTFSKLRTEEEVGEPYMSGLGQDATYVTYANGYYINDGAGLNPTKLTTGFGVDIYTDFGFTTVTGEVREWILDTNGDGIANLETETTLLAQGQVLLDPSNPIDLRNIEIRLDTLSAFTDEFASSGQYLAVIHVAPLTPPSEDTFMAPLSSGFVNNYAGNKDYYFAPADFAFANNGETLGRPSSLSDFAGAAGTPTDQGARNLDPGDGNILSWYIDMEIAGVVSSTVEIDETIDMSIFPNPATDAVTVDLNLAEVSKDVNVQIVDISGKVVANNNFTNVRDNALNINTTELASGVYMINVFTDSGVKSERILIQK